MTRLIQKINEGIVKTITVYNPEEELSKIMKECKKYFNLLNGKPPLMRGTGDKTHSFEYLKKLMRKNRVPRLTPMWAFKVINQLLEENGHVTRNESVSVISNYSRARLFSKMGEGSIFYFVPIGDFKYTWVDSSDFNNSEEHWYINNFIGFLNHLLEDGDKLPKDLTKSDWGDLRVAWEDYMEQALHTNKDFNTGYKKGREFWFTCKTYYLIPVTGKIGELIK